MQTQETPETPQVNQNGKGSRPRTWPSKKYRANYDAIFRQCKDKAYKAQRRLIARTLKP